MKNKILIIIIYCLFLFGCSKKEIEPAANIYQANGTYMNSRTMEQNFEVYQDGTWNSFFIKGVNLGTSTPGKWYTQFPSERELYRSWLEDMAAMNLNTIRVYTLLDPSFYQVLFEFNSNPENPKIWLIQEIWPDDEVKDLNFNNTSYKDAYKEEVQLVVDALHGNAEIPGRPFRAYGNYSADVSQYILGILIGREIIPEEVESTNKLNPDCVKYTGEYVSIKEATSIEVWITEMCDFAMEYAHVKYNWQYPVGFVSWPTLDPLNHPTEQETSEVSASPAYNDRVVINPNKFIKGNKNIAGFFGAYHIYPNYPDFMNNEPDFSNYSDEDGVFRYIGYLNNFMEIHPPYPAVVAEFGISTSLNTAHFNPDGFHHGGISETDQASKIIRMMNAIKSEGYAGGIIFEWADEWAKKTWNTEPYMVPWERHVLWKNVIDPEQNYGIMSVESKYPPFNAPSSMLEVYDKAHESKINIIKSLETNADESFIYLALELENVPLSNSGQIIWDDFNIAIGIDTSDRDAGEYIMPVEGVPKLPTGIEFLLDIQSQENASLLVIPSYNRGNYKFSITSSEKGIFERIITVVNRERITKDNRIFPELVNDESVLTYGNFNLMSSNYNSLAHWYFDLASMKIFIRLPWMLLGVSDPSSGCVINDHKNYKSSPLRDELKIEKTEGFLFYIAANNGGELDYQPRQGDGFIIRKSYLWNLWEEPSFNYRPKKSYDLLAEYFKKL